MKSSHFKVKNPTKHQTVYPYWTHTTLRLLLYQPTMQDVALEKDVSALLSLHLTVKEAVFCFLKIRRKIPAMEEH